MRLLVAAALLTPLWAQVGYYRLAIDQDALGGAPDFSHLNRPLTAADTLAIVSGHFTRVGADLKPGTGDDERIRLFGVNLCFSANFPEPKDAPRIARRLRRLGVNLVRLHHMDTQPDRDPNNAGSLLTTGAYPTLNPVAVARLRALLDAFRAEGIYVNLNLKVGYVFRPAVDQVPALDPFPSQSKPLHIFHPRMVQLQTEYARKVIDALGLSSDPVLAMVEILNEDSLVRAWQTSNLDRYLAGEYRQELERQWAAFLRGRYPSTAALGEAWGPGQAPGPELLTDRWALEKGAPSEGRFELLAGEAQPTVRLEVTAKGPRLILKQVGFSIAAGDPCQAEVEMRLDAPDGVSRSIYWDIKQDVSPWRTMSGRTVAVTSNWQRFQMSFTPSFAMDGIGRFGIAAESLDYPLLVRGWSVRRAGRRGLEAGESLDTGVALVGENEVATLARTDDYLQFLMDRDRSYLNQMLAAVRQSTARQVPVAGTQMGYGGLLNLDSHHDLDYQDHHFYVDHYNFPNLSWDGRDWRMRDASSLAGGLAAFLNVAIACPADRPYTVSEYNQPWPNTYGAEIDPTLAVFGAFQDWDAVMHFAYSHGRGWDDGVPGGFNLNGDWTKFPGFGQAAWLFRSDAIQPGTEPVEIPVSLEMRLRAAREKRNGNIGAFLASAIGYDTNLPLAHPVRLRKDGEAPVPELARQKLEAPFRSVTGQMSYDPGERLFLIHAPKAAGVFGFAGRRKVTAGAIDVELAPSARGFAAILVTPVDQLPLAESRRLLVTNPGHTLRTQPGSDPPRPQKLVSYGGAADWWTLEPEPAYAHKPSGNLNGGNRPVWMERVESYVTLRTGAARITVFPLDGAGARLAALPAGALEKAPGGFRIHLQADGQDFAPWYEVEADFTAAGAAPGAPPGRPSAAPVSGPSARGL